MKIVDANDIARTSGIVALRTAFDAATDIPPPQHDWLHVVGETPATGDSGKRYQLKSVADLPGIIENPRYLAKGLFAPGETSVVYGEPGSAKTFLAALVAYSIAGGRPVFQRRVRANPVVYAALEGEVGFQRRVHALRGRFGPASNFFWLTQPVNLFGSDGDVDALIDAILSVQAAMLFLDTLARAMGAGSENEARDMGIVIAAVDRIKRSTGAHVCLVHHCGKDSTRGMRGHSSLLASVETAIEVKRDGDLRSARVVKSKDGKDGDEHPFVLEVINLGSDEDGDPITTCIPVPATDQALQGKARLSGKNKIAFDLLVRALNELGQLAPSGDHLPRDKSVVSDDVWRQFCIEGMGNSRDKPGTRKRTFNRARDNLKNLNRIGTWGDFVWIL